MNGDNFVLLQSFKLLEASRDVLCYTELVIWATHLGDGPPEFGYVELQARAWACICSPARSPGLLCGCAAPVRHARGESWIKLGFVYILGLFHRSRSVFEMFVYLENSVTCIRACAINALQRH